MKRLLGAGVMVLALAVTSTALADEVAVPTPAPAKEVAAAPAKEVAAAPAKEVAAAPAKEVAAAAPAKQVEPLLALRPTTPLTLASEPASTPWIYKLAFAAAILAAGVIVWKRRRTRGAKRGASAVVRILGKTAMGLRGELALVEVGGMRMLVGITPSSMQTLAILPDQQVEASSVDDGDDDGNAERDSERRGAHVPTKSDFAARARSLFSSLDMGPPVPARAARASAFSASRYADERDIEDAPDSAPAPAPKTRTREPAADRDDDRRRRPAVREIALEGQARGIALALRNKR